ncbi:MAG TPA: hypothetical protein VNK49_00870 [Anaerolineales bacterium]|nr:hypothetical protein [Anaerolineales bacterium]
MAHSILLSPATALRIVWAQMGIFSDDDHSKQTAQEADAILKNIEERSRKNEKEHRYISSAIGAMKASLRSLDIIYKSRQHNFAETEKLRNLYMQSITDSLEFGKKAEDLFKSLPTMTITAAGGITLGELLNLSSGYVWALALGLGAAGYLINLWFVTRSRKQTQMELIQQDYERNLYYKQYIDRVSTVLISLYTDLDRLHTNVFGAPYPLKNKDLGALVNEILSGVRPTFCPLVHEHLRAGKVTPELWALCETGAEEVVRHCPHWSHPR